MMREAAIVSCPECGWPRNVTRVDKRSVYENFPSPVDGRFWKVPKQSPPTVPSRGVFYCSDCGWEFTAYGQTWSESLKVRKIG